MPFGPPGDRGYAQMGSRGSLGLSERMVGVFALEATCSLLRMG